MSVNLIVKKLANGMRRWFFFFFLLERTCVKVSSVQHKLTFLGKLGWEKHFWNLWQKRHSLYMVSVLSDREIDRQICKKYNVTLNKLMRKTKNEYFNNKLQENQGNSTETWDTIRWVIEGKKVVLFAVTKIAKQEI